jgi:hypothetical protein
MPLERIIFIEDLGAGGRGLNIRLTFPPGTTDVEADAYVRLNARVRREVINDRVRERYRSRATQTTLPATSGGSNE